MWWFPKMGGIPIAGWVISWKIRTSNFMIDLGLVSPHFRKPPFIIWDRLPIFIWDDPPRSGGVSIFTSKASAKQVSDILKHLGPFWPAVDMSRRQHDVKINVKGFWICCPIAWDVKPEICRFAMACIRSLFGNMLALQWFFILDG